jgi:hypothetical protein
MMRRSRSPAVSFSSFDKHAFPGSQTFGLSGRFSTRTFPTADKYKLKSSPYRKRSPSRKVFFADEVFGSQDILRDDKPMYVKRGKEWVDFESLNQWDKKQVKRINPVSFFR